MSNFLDSSILDTPVYKVVGEGVSVAIFYATVSTAGTVDNHACVFIANSLDHGYEFHIEQNVQFS